MLPDFFGSEKPFMYKAFFTAYVNFFALQGFITVFAYKFVYIHILSFCAVARGMLMLFADSSVIAVKPYI